MGGPWFKASPSKKVSETSCQLIIPGVGVCACDPSYVRVIGRRNMVRGLPQAKTPRLYFEK
jgi:hypothetical protein